MWGKRSIMVAAGVLGMLVGFSTGANADEPAVAVEVSAPLTEAGVGAAVEDGAVNAGGNATVAGQTVGVGAGTGEEPGLSGGADVPLLGGGCGFDVHVTPEGIVPDVQCGLMDGQVGAGVKLPVGNDEVEGGAGVNLSGVEANVPVKLPFN